MSSKLIYTALFFIGIFGSGFWLSRLGTPYHTLVFTLHKFIGLGIGIFLIRLVVQTQKTDPLAGVQILAIVVTVVFFITAVGAGGAVSAMAGPPAIFGVIHKILPYLIVGVTALMLYFLLGK
jgi:hypothetical protein